MQKGIFPDECGSIHYLQDPDPKEMLESWIRFFAIAQKMGLKPKLKLIYNHRAKLIKSEDFFQNTAASKKI